MSKWTPSWEVKRNERVKKGGNAWAKNRWRMSENQKEEMEAPGFINPPPAT